MLGGQECQEVRKVRGSVGQAAQMHEGEFGKPCDWIFFCRVAGQAEALRYQASLRLLKG